MFKIDWKSVLYNNRVKLFINIILLAGVFLTVNRRKIRGKQLNRGQHLDCKGHPTTLVTVNARNLQDCLVWLQRASSSK